MLVLSPSFDGAFLTGLVVIKETASNKIRKIGTNKGVIYTVKIPETTIKMVADENIALEVLSVRSY